MKPATRGFVTIATGKDHYYKIARNLLYSYKLHAGAYPFAIICDRENAYTSEFDKVVLLNDPAESYLDKLRLFDCLPYDETIFIDADCLVYGDIDRWWELFGQGDDFSVFGYAYKDLSVKKGWFRTEGMKEYREKIHFVPTFTGGVYYLRNTDVCREVFEIAKDAAKHYYEYPFAMFKDPADEPVIALGMAVMNCHPIDCKDVGLYTYKQCMHADISIPKAEWLRNSDWSPVILVHWGNFGTMKAFYLLESAKCLWLLRGYSKNGILWKLLFQSHLLYAVLHICDLFTFGKRINRKIRIKLKYGLLKS